MARIVVPHSRECQALPLQGVLPVSPPDIHLDRETNVQLSMVSRLRQCACLLLIYTPLKRSSFVNCKFKVSCELHVMCSLTCTATSVFPYGTLLQRTLAIRVVNAVAVPSARVAALANLRCVSSDHGPPPSSILSIASTASLRRI
jgi:hypothetical protein